MNITSKSSAKKIALVISATCLLIVVFWIGSGLLRPAEVSPPAPPKKPVTFNPSLDIRSHPLFADLQSYFEWDPHPTQLGNPYPLVGSDIQGGAGISVLQLRPFAVLQTIDSGEGWSPQALSHLVDGTAAVLWQKRNADTILYEIRQYPSTSTHDVMSSWSSDGSPLQTVRAFAQTSNGTTWLLNLAGGVGMVEKGKDTPPTWLTDVQTGLSGSRLRMYVDPGDRVWITDGASVAVGGEQGFEPVDLLNQLTASGRTELQSQLQAAIQSQEQNDAKLRSLLRPLDFFALNAGKTGLTTQSGVFIFPLSTFARPEWVNFVHSGILPLAIAKDGGVWGVHASDQALEYAKGTTTQSFLSTTIAPRDARSNPNVFTFLDTRAYAFDYAPTSTILWHNDGANWVAQWMTTSTLPEARTIDTIIDRKGTIWSRMSDGKLLHISP